ncbi:hypothetical protein [Haloarcula marina]|uniref:hypothetical protein n=1 Tax=Haloarcula marina TaxID=2961574 RepID=UPI0020B7D13B|nr:hypothetical protein [Halomicroarcula marina]
MDLYSGTHSARLSLQTGTGGSLEVGREFDDDFDLSDRALSLDQLRDLQDVGWGIGIHTVDRERFMDLNTDAVRSQIGGAKELLLERGIENGASTFVYPWSSNDPRM